LLYARWVADWSPSPYDDGPEPARPIAKLQPDATSPRGDMHGTARRGWPGRWFGAHLTVGGTSDPSELPKQRRYSVAFPAYGPVSKRPVSAFGYRHNRRCSRPSDLLVRHRWWLTSAVDSPAAERPAQASHIPGVVLGRSLERQPGTSDIEFDFQTVDRNPKREHASVKHALRTSICDPRGLRRRCLTLGTEFAPNTVRSATLARRHSPVMAQRLDMRQRSGVFYGSDMRGR
jgi:hypothetical protein